MKVKGLIEALEVLPGDMDVRIANVHDDGDGDGLQSVWRIEYVAKERGLVKGKEKDVVLLMFEK